MCMGFRGKRKIASQMNEIQRKRTDFFAHLSSGDKESMLMDIKDMTASLSVLSVMIQNVDDIRVSMGHSGSGLKRVLAALEEEGLKFAWLKSLEIENGLNRSGLYGSRILRLKTIEVVKICGEDNVKGVHIWGPGKTFDEAMIAINELEGNTDGKN